MADCMFRTHYHESGKTYWIYAISRGATLHESPGYDSIEKMVARFKKILKPKFRGKIQMLANAPEFLQEVVAQLLLEAQHGGTPPAFEYLPIEEQDQKTINDLLPEGIEIEFV